MNIEAVTSKIGGAFREAGVSLELVTPQGRTLLGDGPPDATVTLHSSRALRRLLLFDENGLVESYLSGEVDIEGSLPDVLKCRALLKKSHGVRWLARFIIPALFGQVFANRSAILKHYDLDPEFYLSFLDEKWPAYSQGIYESRDEPLSAALERKFAFATEACNINSGSSVLEVGPGWGAYLLYLLPRGAKVTAITISPQSKAYLEDKFSSPLLTVAEQDFLSYRPERRFDAVTIMGVLEHLPHYEKVCRKLRELLSPGGYAYIDASASRTKYAMSEFIYKHIFPLNHSFLHLDGFLKAARGEGLEVASLNDDSRSYQYTIEAWAKNLELRREKLVRLFGEYNFRRFRLYLWGSARAFEEGALQCHRLVLRAPR